MIEDETERSAHTHDVHEQDLREAEELVAGFKRRRRAPRRPSGSDFIGYHMSKESAPRARPAGTPAARRARPTLVIPRESRRSEWIVWGAIGAGMILLGGTIAYLVSNAGVATATAAPARALAVAPPPSQPMPPSNRDIPPPAAVEDDFVDTPVSTPPIRRASRARLADPAARHEQEPAAASSATSDYRKREDFIRDF